MLCVILPISLWRELVATPDTSIGQEPERVCGCLHRQHPLLCRARGAREGETEGLLHRALAIKSRETSNSPCSRARVFKSALRLSLVLFPSPNIDQCELLSPTCFRSVCAVGEVKAPASWCSTAVACSLHQVLPEFRRLCLFQPAASSSEELERCIYWRFDKFANCKLQYITAVVYHSPAALLRPPPLY